MAELFDIAVIGAGPAGAHAALAASEKGFGVVLVDEQTCAGGQVWRAKDHSILSAPQTPESRAGSELRQKVQASNISHRADTRVWQIEKSDASWSLQAFHDGTSSPIAARALIIASGAREVVHPLPGWTTPGVIGLAGATALFKQSLAVPGQRTVVSGTGPLVFFVASEIRRLGGQVVAIVTPNTRGDWLKALPAMLSRPDLLARGALWMADLMLSSVPIHWGHTISGVFGERHVKRLDVCKVDDDWAPAGTVFSLDADSLCLGHGLVPSVQAAQLAGVLLKHRDDLGGWVPKLGEDGTTDVDGLFLCGDGTGIRGVAAAQLHGQLAGLNAADYLGSNTTRERTKLRPRYVRAARFGMAMTALSRPRPGLGALTRPDTVLCRCESLTRAAIEKELMRGAGSMNAVKSGLRMGMGPCGGRYCQSAVARLIAASAGLSETDVPLATPRPPLRPVPMSAIAGEFDYADLPIPKPAPL